MRVSAGIKNQLHITRLYTAFKQTFSPGFFYKGETHNFFEIVIVLEGTIGVLAGNDIYTLTKGQLIIHNAMEFHRFWVENNSSSAKVLIFTFSAENMPCSSSRLLDVPDLDYVERILDKVNNSFEISGISALTIQKGCETQANIAMKELELLILNAVANSAQTVHKKMPRRAHQFEAIINFLERNEHRTLTVSEIANATNMCESNVQKIVLKYTGMGVISYFTYLKMTSALSMIQSGKPIKEVALLHGYLNQNYFSTVFKNFWGDSPTRFKPR